MSKDEVLELAAWLRQNRHADLPGIAFLTETLSRIIADGHISRDEQRELLEAIEKVLPPEARRTAKAARKSVEVKHKAAEKAAKDEQRRRELEEHLRRSPVDDFDFMVAGVHFEGRHSIIAQCLSVGDRVRLCPEPDNPKDECAVAVTLTDGHKIGYVPRTESEDVSGCIDDGGYYVATVKKILTGGNYPIPVIVVEFYRDDQFELISDLCPDPCRVALPSVKAVWPAEPSPLSVFRVPIRPYSQPQKPWWKFW
ncbi:MAG TPA: HIRAN domain-containing protein [Pirellulales bacterium]